MMLFLLPVSTLQVPVPDVDELLDAARSARNQKHWPEAIRLYSQVLAQYPDLDRALFERAQIYGWTKQHAAAIRDFRRHLQLYPDQARETEKALAKVLAWSKQFKAGIALLEPQAQRGDREALLDQATFLSWDHQLSRALGITEAFLRVHPEDVEFQILRGRVLSWAGRHGEARAAYQAVLRTTPRHKEALMGLAQLDLWQGFPEGAASRLQALTPEDAGTGEAALLSSQLLQRQGRLRAARSAVAPWRQDPELASDVNERLWDLAAAQGPYLEFSHGRTDSNEGLRQDMDTVEAGLPFLEGTLRLGGTANDLAQTDGPSASPTQAFLGLSHPLGSRWRAGFNVSRVSQAGNAAATDLGIFVNVRAMKGLNLGLAFERSTSTASPRALQLRTITTGFTFQGGYTFGETLNLATWSLERAELSAGSRRQALTTSYTRRFVFQDGEVRLGGNLRLVNHNPPLQLGFFTPEHFRIYALTTGFSLRREGVWEFDFDGQAGSQRVNEAPSTFAWGYSGSLSATPWTPAVVLFASFGESVVALPTTEVTDPTQYRDKSFRMGVRLRAKTWLW